MSDAVYCDSDEWPQDEIPHCDSCHGEWEAYDSGTIDCDHQMDTDLKDGRYLIYCCRAIGWFEERELIKK